MNRFVPLFLCVAILIILSYNSYGSIGPVNDLFSPSHISNHVAFDEIPADEEQEEIIETDTTVEDTDDYESEWPD